MIFMIHIKDQKQQQLFDLWDFLSPKRRKMLAQSWPGFFKDVILPELPVDKLAPFFDSILGRPTKELYSVLGTMILLQTLDFRYKYVARYWKTSTLWIFGLAVFLRSHQL